MRLNEAESQQTRTALARPLQSFDTIAAHPSFVPMLTAWGAALGGLSFAVLPTQTTASIAASIGLGAIGSAGAIAVPVLVAALGGASLYPIARRIQTAVRNAGQEGVVEEKGLAKAALNTVRPIDPVEELGSESLDAPLDEDGDSDGLEEESCAPTAPDEPQDQTRGPTLGELSQRGYEIEEPQDMSSDDGGAAPKPLFTRRDYEAAMIATCESENCAADEAADEDEDAPAVQTCEPQVETPSPIDPAHQITIKTGIQSAARPIGAAGGCEAWSLTQFEPDCEPQADREDAGLKPADADDRAEAAKAEGAEDTSAPIEMALSEFAALPSRNAVWVEEEADQPAEQAPADTAQAPTPIAAQAAAKVAATNGLELIRSQAPENLSLVAMVERFAAALQEHEDAISEAPQRSAVLAEALKALTLFAEDDLVPAQPLSKDPQAVHLSETERELRDALGKLQSLRGAA